MNLKYIGLLVMFALVVTASNYLIDVNAYKQSGQLNKTPETFYIRGDLSAKTLEKSYGGDTIGEFTIIVNVNQVKILATLDDYAQNKVMEAWLIDSNTDQMLNTGTFDGNKLASNVTIETWSYNIIQIIEKTSDENSEIGIPIGGSLLEKESEYKSCKCQ